jgi:hypothetical protein
VSAGTGIAVILAGWGPGLTDEPGPGFPVVTL